MLKERKNVFMTVRNCTWFAAEKGKKCSAKVGAVQFQRIKNLKTLCEEALGFFVQSQTKSSQHLCDHVPAPAKQANNARFSDQNTLYLQQITHKPNVQKKKVVMA